MNKVTSLYKKHKIIYTDPVPGKFNKIRITSMSILGILFFTIPLIKYEDKHIFIFDIKNTKLYFLNYIIWPQDFFLIAIFLIFSILLLFATTVYLGRVWCGFLCPQSIWLRMSNFITRIIEGNRIKRFNLDNNKKNKSYYIKKIIKHTLLLILSLITSIVFVSYFISIYKIYENIKNLTIINWNFFWILFFSILTYLNIYWFKEQFCFLVCPYARLQSVMFDNNTIIVNYDEKRGEKRGHRKIGIDHKGIELGDCIDCKKCVTCCPTGIDIRDGLQIECISCGACVDACNSVMKKMNYEPNLIKYSKENKIKKLNIKLIAYIFFLLIIFFVFIFAIINRDLINLNINRSQIKLYNKTQDGFIENFYTIKITNKDNKTNTYSINLENKDFIYENNNIILNSEEIAFIDIKVKIDEKKIKKKFTELSFKIKNLNNEKDYMIKKTKFITDI